MVHANIIVNGALCEADLAAVKASDRGFTLGDGVFDTMLCRHGEVLHLNQHLQRLENHCSKVKMEIKSDLQNVKGDILKLIAANHLQDGHAAIRVTITRGASKARGLSLPDHPTLTIIIQSGPVPAPGYQALKAVRVSYITRRNEYSPLSRIKSTHYGDHILALSEAQEQGADDAILLNTKSHVTCATAGNLFVSLNGQLFTPPLEDGVMDGITRQILLEQSPFKIRERSLTTDDLQDSDCLFISNSIRGLMPVSHLNETPLPAPDMDRLRLLFKTVFGD